MANSRQAAAALPTLNPKRRRRVRLGTTAVFVTLMAFVGAANVLIHRAFHMQKATQQQATAAAKRTSTSNNNWKPPNADRFAAATNRDDAVGDASTSTKIDGADDHPLAGLDCTPHGGPDNKVAEEMVFWEDIESDSKYKSPFLREDGPTQYLTFEPDHGGWNNVRKFFIFSFNCLLALIYFNHHVSTSHLFPFLHFHNKQIRMAMETTLVMAHAMGRTLVLPPEKGMYLLGQDKDTHKTQFTFNDFFHLDSIAVEHDGFNVITTEEFLRREGLTGNLKDHRTGKVVKPPNDQVDWNGKALGPLEQYLRTVGVFPTGWNPDSCVAAIPASRDPKDVESMKKTMDDILNGVYGPLPDNENDYDDKPTPVDGPVADRLREMLGGRKKLCIYDEELQNAPVIHMAVQGGGEKSRLLTHFYAFIFFQSYMDDLYYKRFVRDHVRYIDEIVCAAARVVSALREKIKSLGKNADGIYDSFHVRRGDFQYKKTRIPATEIYDRSKEQLTEGTTIFVATDERDKSFFDPLKEHYTLFFLDDFMDQIKGINSNYYGMIDQLIASRGRIFFGTWFSTLSGYINRMRGYASQKDKLDGYLLGKLNSYYFNPSDREKYQMVVYKPVKLPIYMREFPVSFRDIDRNIEDIHDENARKKAHQQ